MVFKNSSSLLINIAFFFLGFFLVLLSSCVTNPKPDPGFLGKWIGNTTINGNPVSIKMIFDPDKSFMIEASIDSFPVISQFGTWSQSAGSIIIYTDYYYSGQPGTTLKQSTPPTPVDSMPKPGNESTWLIQQTDPQNGSTVTVLFYRVY